MDKEMRRHLGTVDIGNFFKNKVLWLNIIPYPECIRYQISFCVQSLPDKFDSDKELPIFKIGDKERKFHSYYMNGGLRYRHYNHYYKIYLDLENTDEVSAVINNMKQQPVKGIFTFTLTKELEHLINEFKISLL